MTLKQILSLVSSKLPPSFDRENVAAELWLGAWQRFQEATFHKPDPLLNPLDPPLSERVIHNRCVDEIRKRKRDVTLTDLPALAPGQEEESTKYLENLIESSQLSRQAQRIILEKFFLGSSLKLIAEHLDLRPEEVQRILHQTLERLRAVAREVKSSDFDSSQL